MSKVLYRYEIEYKSEDGPTSIRLVEIPVVRETEKTYFVKRWAWSYTADRRVLKSGYNSYAHDTKEAAKKHFVRRTRKRIAWYEFWQAECEKALALIEEVV